MLIGLIGLLGLPGLASPAPPAAQDDAPAAIECPSCEGSGRALVDCWVCGGDGEHACVVSSRFRAQPVSRGATGWTSPAALRVVNARVLDSIQDLKLPKLPPLPGLSGGKKAPKGVSLKAGERRCPSGCTGGELLLVDDWVDCKTCKKGKFDCAFCKRGEVDCDPCRGKGRVKGACDTCAGVGTLPDASGLVPSTCPWCLGTRSRACGTCDENGEAERACLTCYDSREVACEICEGFGVNPCSKCRGRGRTGLQKQKCPVCDGDGASKCRTCDNGVRSCKDCEDGDPLHPCPDCIGAKRHACNGCGDAAYVAWEVAAELESAAGRHARAGALLKVARDRCRGRYAVAAAQYAQGKDEEFEQEILAALERERDDELERLDDLIEDAEAAETRAAKDGRDG